MSAQVIVHGMLKSDGTLELDQRLNLTRVRVTVEPVTDPIRPERFWAMMQQIWTDLKASGHVPRSVEAVESERQAFRDEWDQRQEALEAIHHECDRAKEQNSQAKEPSE
jgi:hypothetical protein